MVYYSSFSFISNYFFCFFEEKKYQKLLSVYFFFQQISNNSHTLGVHPVPSFCELVPQVRANLPEKPL